jgi:ornithine cyclodeaminase
MQMIGPEAQAVMTWAGLMAAIEAGHRLPRAEIADLLLYRGPDVLLDRAAWITGLGSLVKVGTITAGNAGKDPSSTVGEGCHVFSTKRA